MHVAHAAPTWQRPSSQRPSQQFFSSAQLSSSFVDHDAEHDVPDERDHVGEGNARVRRHLVRGRIRVRVRVGVRFRVGVWVKLRVWVRVRVRVLGFDARRGAPPQS